MRRALRTPRILALSRPRRLALLALVPLLFAAAAAARSPGVATAARPLVLGERTLAVAAIESGSGSELRLLLRGPAGEVEIAPPAGRVATRRDEPVALAVGDGLAALAWLEGTDRRGYGVRFAPRAGDGWGPIEEVAAPGPGSQLALAATALADGRILLVWAAYDGEDDEIVYALRGAAGGWSAPARVDADDRLPDITPAVVAVDEGALIAWSGLEGDEYRVSVARFDGERFRPARALGPAGSLFPEFEPGDGAPLVVYRNARPRGWSVAELDRSGAPRRSAFVATEERDPPAILARGELLRLGWGARSVETPWR